MKKWLAIVGAMVLTACSSGSETKSYYQLPLMAQAGAQSTASQGNRLLWVEQVAVPDYLAGNGVVYQTSDVQYVIANNNLWASPLDQQLRNTLVANLSTQLPGWVVASQPLGSVQDTLNVTVTGFHGRYDGKVVVSEAANADFQKVKMYQLTEQGVVVQATMQGYKYWPDDELNTAR